VVGGTSIALGYRASYRNGEEAFLCSIIHIDWR
jgi:hypothetical protein